MLDNIVFGPLETLARDPAVTDVAVTCDGLVWVDRGGGMRRWTPPIPFSSPATVRDYAVQLAAQLGRRLDDACPIADASSPGGIRIHAVIAPLVPQGAAISIRFPARSPPRLEALCAQGLFPGLWVPILCSLVDRRATLLITGGTGAGKTTLLKALLGRCSANERIVTVEEVRELGELGGGNRVSLVTRESNVEGEGAVGLPELVKATLRMRPDRVILGECRGEEIADLLRAFNSGHHGGMTTLHADSVERVPNRLASLGLLAGLSVEATAMLAQDAFDAVFHVKRDASGRRFISQIGYLGVDADGRLGGRVVAVWDGSGTPMSGPLWDDFADRWVR
ncbi:Flp pilus assembly complex ATPase component TadA [Bifidobacterium amazonense]|uniref:Flp pilus assembly complex ATPase component TadA n=1 Tax=Bifidobacterium amazonense TaxID=2809027 RepID=A0ABS9VWV9_9BIFI|nr:ATPase, T2SS/T4P/T4SS family [Bifidobacterium amazonense]MCH9276603.1 Flp pilus assembly complex ATPase component TadA [Bifidobacterium amazonense]